MIARGWDGKGARQEAPMVEKRYPGESGKGFVRRAGDSLRTAIHTLRGQNNVEHQVAEYSDAYTRVVLGLQEDIDSQARKADEHDKAIHALELRIASMRSIRAIAIAALVVALLALGVALWAVLIAEPQPLL